jgi:transcription initiation factor IIF auxiliary subunit
MYLLTDELTMLSSAFKEQMDLLVEKNTMKDELSRYIDRKNADFTARVAFETFIEDGKIKNKYTNDVQRGAAVNDLKNLDTEYLDSVKKFNLLAVEIKLLDKNIDVLKFRQKNLIKVADLECARLSQGVVLLQIPSGKELVMTK